MEKPTMRNKLAKLAPTAALVLAITLTLSCSDDGGGGNELSSLSSSGETTKNSSSSKEANATVKKAEISGVFQKGPFVEGTTATLNELDYDLNPTGRPYQTLITDNKGTFTLRDVELVSPYAHLIANGFFLNEVTGKKSNAQITLQAIVDVTDKENVNVNILTHLEYYRVLDLVDGGMTVKAAKKQAQKEILAVFGIDGDSFKESEDMDIFGTSESDAALLAISVLLLGDLSEADFTQRLMNFSQAIRTSGKWENEEEKSKIAGWGRDITYSTRDSITQYCKYDNDAFNCWPMPTNDNCRSGVLVDFCHGSWELIPSFKFIRNNILDWGLSPKIPDFEKYVRNYWVASYGLGECGASNEREFKIANNISFICKNNAWERPTRLDYLLSGKEECEYSYENCVNYECETILSKPIAEEDYIFVCKEDGFWQVSDISCEKVYPYEGKPDFELVCEDF
jgi:hypothetical protein